MKHSLSNQSWTKRTMRTMTWEARTQNNCKSGNKSNETQAQREVLFQEFHEFQDIGNPLSKPLMLEFYQ